MSRLPRLAGEALFQFLLDRGQLGLQGQQCCRHGRCGRRALAGQRFELLAMLRQRDGAQIAAAALQAVCLTAGVVPILLLQRQLQMVQAVGTVAQKRVDQIAEIIAHQVDQFVELLGIKCRHRRLLPLFVIEPVIELVTELPVVIGFDNIATTFELQRMTQ